jgi:hypothetical protein
MSQIDDNPNLEIRRVGAKNAPLGSSVDIPRTKVWQMRSATAGVRRSASSGLRQASAHAPAECRQRRQRSEHAQRRAPGAVLGEHGPGPQPQQADVDTCLTADGYESSDVRQPKLKEVPATQESRAQLLRIEA